MGTFHVSQKLISKAFVELFVQKLKISSKNGIDHKDFLGNFLLHIAI